MKLTAENAQNVIMSLLLSNEEANHYGVNHDTDISIPIDGLTFVKGVVRNFVFATDRIDASKDDVISMLGQLPDDFMAGKGGGSSMMAMPFDRYGNQWGEQIDAEVLYVLGAALGLCTMPLPRAMWSTFPGGMPYITVTLPDETTA